MRDPIHDNRDLLSRSWAEARTKVFGDPKEAAAADASRKQLTSYEERPVEFVHEVLGDVTWSAQRGILRALQEKHLVLVCGCRKSSKSHTSAQAVTWAMGTGPTRCIVTAASFVQARNNVFALVRKLAGTSRIPLPGRRGVTSWRTDDPTWYALGVSTDTPDNIVGFHAGVTLPEKYLLDDPPEFDEAQLPAPDPRTVDEELRLAERDPGDVVGETIYTHKRKNDRARLLWVLDELAGMRPDIIEAILGSLMGDRAYAIAPYNPTFAPDSGHPAARFLNPGSRFHRIHIAGREPPVELHPPDMFDQCFHRVPDELMPDKWVEQSISDWGEGTALTLAHVYGLPSTADRERQFIPYRILNEASIRGVTVTFPREFRHLGWDVAGSEGGDDNVAQLWVNGLPTDQHVWKEANTARSREMVEGMAREWKVPDHQIHVDATGGSMGKSVVDEWRNRGRYVDGVDFGSSPRGAWRSLYGPRMQFVNLKAELLWSLRALLQKGWASIPRTFPETFQQAQWYTYKEVTRDKGTALQCAEDKPKIKKLYGRSPDHLEAAILAQSRAAVGPPTIRSGDNIEALLGGGR